MEPVHHFTCNTPIHPWVSLIPPQLWRIGMTAPWSPASELLDQFFLLWSSDMSLSLHPSPFLWPHHQLLWIPFPFPSSSIPLPFHQYLLSPSREVCSSTPRPDMMEVAVIPSQFSPPSAETQLDGSSATALPNLGFGGDTRRVTLNRITTEWSQFGYTETPTFDYVP